MKRISLFLLILILCSELSFADTSSQNCPNLKYNQTIGSKDKYNKGETTKLQIFLKNNLNLSGTQFLVTGVFGKVTSNFVKIFQQKNNLIMTGQVGKVTRTKILNSCVVQNIPVQQNIQPTQPTNTIQSGNSVNFNSSSSVSGSSNQIVTPVNTTNNNSSSSSTTSPNLNNVNFTNAVNDLFKNFWTGDRATGHIIPTLHGYSVTSNGRGGLWETDTMMEVLFENYKINPTTANAQPIQAEWNYIKSTFSDSELTVCGNATPVNWGSDDTGWDGSLFLDIYEVTHDNHALDLAKNIVQCGFNRWGDNQLGGGLWYNDDLNIKSLYGIGLADDAFRIYQLTGDSTYLGYTQFSYNWMESNLKRSDNLYWADYGWPTSNHSTSATPIGVERPSDIHLAGSVSFLAGNMGMDIMHSRMYKLTGDESYHQKINSVATAILNTYQDSSGAFLDDRDGWANGHFVFKWLTEVYPLLTPSLQQKAQQMFAQTAQLSIKNNRTTDGYYGAAWSGPLNSAWSQIGTVPQQIMTSSNAVNFISGPAVIDAQIPVSNISKFSGTLPVFTQQQMNISATLLGQTGEDFVGTNSVSADGVKDVHIRLSGITSEIKSVSVTSPDGLWSYPQTNGDWVVSVKPESDPTVVDLYFDFYKNESSYSVGITFANGKSTVVKTTTPQPINISASYLGQTGEDFVGTNSVSADGVKDVHIKLTGVTVPINGVGITTSSSGNWVYPPDGNSWIVSVKPESDPSVVDLYFDYYQNFSSYNLNLKFSDGRSTTVVAQ